MVISSIKNVKIEIEAVFIEDDVETKDQTNVRTDEVFT